MEKVLYSQVNDNNVGGVTEMAVRLLLLERVSGARFGATRTGLSLGKVSVTLLFNWQEGVDMQYVFSFMLRLIV